MKILWIDQLQDSGRLFKKCKNIWYSHTFLCNLPLSKQLFSFISIEKQVHSTCWRKLILFLTNLEILTKDCKFLVHKGFFSMEANQSDFIYTDLGSLTAIYYCRGLYPRSCLTWCGEKNLNGSSMCMCVCVCVEERERIGDMSISIVNFLSFYTSSPSPSIHRSSVLF